MEVTLHDFQALIRRSPRKPCSVHRGILERSLCEKPAVREAQQPRHHHVVRKLALWRSSVGRGKLAWSDTVVSAV